MVLIPNQSMSRNRQSKKLTQHTSGGNAAPAAASLVRLSRRSSTTCAHCRAAVAAVIDDDDDAVKTLTAARRRPTTRRRALVRALVRVLIRTAAATRAVSANRHHSSNRARCTRCRPAKWSELHRACTCRRPHRCHRRLIYKWHTVLAPLLATASRRDVVSSDAVTSTRARPRVTPARSSSPTPMPINSFHTNTPLTIDEHPTCQSTHLNLMTKTVTLQNHHLNIIVLIIDTLLVGQLARNCLAKLLMLAIMNRLSAPIPPATTTTTTQLITTSTTMTIISNLVLVIVKRCRHCHGVPNRVSRAASLAQN
mmetsp:Transcript_16331/g.27983  ORF Transcript_16331/g.27983 Transcript_16331/m.27983 type:complete len:310 (+) Transcript_16331:2041-2970(+)